MRISVIILIFIFFIFLELSLPPGYFFYFLMPNFILVFLAVSIFYLDFKEFIILVFMAGFILGMTSILPFGFFLVTYFILGNIFYFLRKIFHEKYFYSALIFAGSGTVIYYFLIFAVILTLSYIEKTLFISDLKNLFLKAFIGGLVSNLALAVFFFFFVKKLFGWLSYYKK